jgi:hypothetical protein
MSRRAIVASGIAAVAVLGAGVGWLATHGAAPSAEEQWPLFAQYCVECHNRAEFTADIAFDGMSAESIAH